MKTLKVSGREYSLRIYSRYLAEVQEKLPEGKAFAEAIMEASTNPVANTVPFLWGIIQDRKSDERKSMEDAYDLYDQLVDEGFSGYRFSELVLDICTASGFFDDRGEKMMRSSLEKVRQVMERAGNNLLATIEPVKTPEAPKIVTPGKSTSRRRPSAK